jgi:hypothetical protein
MMPIFMVGSEWTCAANAAAFHTPRQLAGAFAVPFFVSRGGVECGRAKRRAAQPKRLNEIFRSVAISDDEDVLDIPVTIMASEIPCSAILS